MRVTLGDRILGSAGPLTRGMFRRARRRDAVCSRAQLALLWQEFSSRESAEPHRRTGAAALS
jgi:hypothetical protein